MNKKIEELIALGASVSAHCFPCIDHHLKQAKKLGISNKDIYDAVRVGLEVMNGAGGKIKEKIRTELPGMKIKENRSCVQTQGKNEIKIIPFIHF